MLDFSRNLLDAGLTDEEVEKMKNNLSPKQKSE